MSGVAGRLSAGGPWAWPRRPAAVALAAVLLHGLAVLGLLHLGGRSLSKAAPGPQPALQWLLHLAPPEVRTPTAAVARLAPSAPVARPAPPAARPRAPTTATVPVRPAAAVPEPAHAASLPTPERQPSDPSPAWPADAASGAAVGGTRAPAAASASSVVPTQPAVEPPPASRASQGARPDYAHNPPPDYPLALREQGLGGVVWLRVWVDPEGRPAEILLARGSGYRLLDEAALRAVRQWRFVPAREGGRRLASWVEFPIRFEMDG